MTHGVVLWMSVLRPFAVFPVPVVLLKSAAAPVAVLLSPVLSKSVSAPIAVLNFPVVVLLSEKDPIAVLNVPPVRLSKAFCPSAVLFPGYPPSGGGLSACILSARTKPTNASAREMSTAGKPRTVRSELLDVVTLFMAIVFFLFWLVVFNSLETALSRSREGSADQGAAALRERRESSPALREWRARKKIL